MRRLESTHHRVPAGTQALSAAEAGATGVDGVATVVPRVRVVTAVAPPLDGDGIAEVALDARLLGHVRGVGPTALAHLAAEAVGGDGQILVGVAQRAPHPHNGFDLRDAVADVACAAVPVRILDEGFGRGQTQIEGSLHGQDGGSSAHGKLLTFVPQVCL